MSAPKNDVEADGAAQEASKPKRSRARFGLGKAILGLAAGVATAIALTQILGQETPVSKDYRQQSKSSTLLPTGAAPFHKGDQLHPPFYEVDLASEPHVYGRLESDDAFYFRVLPPVQSAMSTFVMYLNLDQDRATGAEPAGSDIYLVVQFQQGAPDLILYKGCQLGSPDIENCREKLKDDFSFTDVSVTATGGCDFKLSKFELETLSGVQVTSNIGIMINLVLANGQQQPMPRSFTNWYTLRTGITSLPSCGDEKDVRGAVVFSQLVSDNFFSGLSYTQLYMSTQSQLVQGGLPFDRIDVSQLLDPSLSCKYKVLVVPFLAFVEEENLQTLRDSLHILVHYYGVSIVTVGDFMTSQNNSAVQGGNPYHSMTTLFGVKDSTPVFQSTSETSVYVSDTTESFFSDRTLFEEIMNQGQTNLGTNYLGTVTNMFEAAENTSFVVQTIAQKDIVNTSGEKGTFNAILASKLPSSLNPYGRISGRAVHFSGIEVFANVDLAWRAARWALENSETSGLGLQIGRQDSIFVARGDMHKYRFPFQFPIIEAAYSSLLKKWYQKYNYVAEHYVTVGNKPDDETTRWDQARPLYNAVRDLESEIGCHTYSQPSDVESLSVSEREVEFNQSRAEIAAEMGLSSLGGSLPGNPITLETTLQVGSYFAGAHFSGSYSQVGVGYPSAIGHVGLEDSFVYLSPNMLSDFTAFEVLQFSPVEIEGIWKEQFDNLTKWANMPVMHWHYHDFGPLDWGFGEGNLLIGNVNQGPGYTEEMYENFIAYAQIQGTEFISATDLTERFTTFNNASLQVSAVSDETYKVLVPEVSGRSLGKFALAVASGPKKIVSVKDYYAYSESKIFLSKAGGEFEVTMTESSDTVSLQQTHLSSLDMRMDLLDISGDGRELQFQVEGRGNLTVDLLPGAYNITTSAGVIVSMDGNSANVTCPTFGVHDIAFIERITERPTSSPSAAPSHQPTETPTKAPSSSPTTASPTREPTAKPTSQPTRTPSQAPTSSPNNSPTVEPTNQPTSGPTVTPSAALTVAPTGPVVQSLPLVEISSGAGAAVILLSVVLVFWFKRRNEDRKAELETTVIVKQMKEASQDSNTPPHL